MTETTNQRPILAEAGVYAGQCHPCFGCHPVALGTDSWFTPWIFDGSTVWWGPILTTRSEALEFARIHAHETFSA